MKNGKRQRKEIGERMWLMRNEFCYSDLVYAGLLDDENERVAGFIWMIYLGKD